MRRKARLLMFDQKVKNLVTAWFSGDEGGIMFDACVEEPEVVWQAISQILQRDLTEDQTALLAGGPLEDLLARHGSVFIDRVEEEAKLNPRFNYLLGGVWRHEMPQEIWERITKARKEVW